MVEFEDELRAWALRPPAAATPAEEIHRRATLRQHRRQAATAAVVVVLAAVAVAVLATRTSDQSVQTVGPPSIDDGATVTTGPRDGRSTVLRLAEIAESRSPIATSENPVIHTRIVSWGTTTAPGQPGVQEHQYEQWILGNGRRRMRSDVGGRVLPWGAQDWEWQDVPANAVSESKEVPIDRAPPGGLAQTSQSLANQSDHVDETTGPSSTPLAARRVIDGITAANPAPPIQAGWYRELADAPDLHVEPQATDRAGRTGLGLTITQHGSGYVTTQMLIIDPTTATVLATRTETTLTPDTSQPNQTRSQSETDYYLDAVPDAPPATIHFS